MILVKPIWIAVGSSKCVKSIDFIPFIFNYRSFIDNCANVRQIVQVVKNNLSPRYKWVLKIRFSDPDLVEGCGRSSNMQSIGQTDRRNIAPPSERSSTSSTHCIWKHVSITFVVSGLPTATRHRYTTVETPSNITSAPTATSKSSGTTTSRIAKCGFTVFFRSFD